MGFFNVNNYFLVFGFCVLFSITLYPICTLVLLKIVILYLKRKYGET